MDIKDKLRMLESLPRNRVGQKENAQNPTRVEAVWANHGQYIQTPHGRFSRFEKTYEPGFRHGEVALSTFLEQPADLLALASGATEVSGIDLKKTLFIDTETTGLSGGAGTCAFLIGVGHFTENGFSLIQFFMNDFNEERPIFHELNQFLAEFDLIVSYNGKSFDVPLLTSRNIYHGQRTPFERLVHVDLLHSVRRLWNHRLPDCSLETAESAILQATRHGDIPGYLIPYRYFDYLRTRDFGNINPILYHNQQDILALAALTAHVMYVLSEPMARCQDIRDLLRVGRLFERAERRQDATAFYNACIENTNESIHHGELYFRLGFNHKKLQEWDAASQAWRTYLERGRFHPLPYVELAKHQEHRQKDYGAAISLVNKGLAELEILRGLGKRIDHWQEYEDDLQYRLKRLQKKSIKSGSDSEGGQNVSTNSGSEE